MDRTVDGFRAGAEQVRNLALPPVRVCLKHEIDRLAEAGYMAVTQYVRG
jgi:hypothetical protein